MKYVYPTQAHIAHLWANATQSHARCTNASFREGLVDGSTTAKITPLLSYSTVIAYRVESDIPDADPMFVIEHPSGWSMTTQKHIRAAIDAVPLHQRDNMCVVAFPGRYSTEYPWTDTQARDQIVAAMTENLTTAAAARTPDSKQRSTYKGLKFGEDYNNMIAWVHANAPCWATATPDRIDIDAVMGTDYKALAKERRAHDRANAQVAAQRIAAQREQQAHHLEDWRNHVPVVSDEHRDVIQKDTPIRLSMDGTHVETMRSAEVPIAHAQQLWRVLQWDELRRVELALSKAKLGVYTINHVSPSRDITVGCHIITFKEMQLLAAKHPDLFPSTTTTESE